VPDDLIGKNVKCPGCLRQFVATADTGLSRREESFRATEEPSTMPRGDNESPRDTDDAFRAKEEQPVRPGRLPRLDDYEDDDDLDDFPRRRRRGPNREFALSRVSGPANGLMAAGIIGIIVCLLGVAGGAANVGGGGRGARAAPFVAAGNAAGNVVGSVIGLATSILVVVGAQKMKNLESYGLAKAAAIIAIIPCISPCCILGIPFGIMALNALNDPGVKQAFDTGQRFD